MAQAPLTVRLDLGGLMCASDHPHVLLALSKSHALGRLIMSRIHQLPDFLVGGHQSAGGVKARDIFGAQVLQRLLAEAHLVVHVS